MDSVHTWRRMVGWAALVVLLLWLLAFLNGVLIQSNAFPQYADRFVPAKIQSQ